MFWFRCLAVLELPGAVFFCWDGEGRQRKVASLRGVDAGGVFLRFCGVDGEGRQEKGGIGPGVDAGGMFLRF